MKLHPLAAGALACALLVPATAQASSLTLYDNYRGQGVAEDASISSVVWTLALEDNCVQCEALLTADFTGTNNYYAGSYLDSVQWVVSKPDAEPHKVGYNGFYVNGTLDPKWKQEWSFAIDQALGSHQCNGSSHANDAICGEWILGGAAGGYGAITSGTVLAWTFLTMFEDQLPTALRGNIRGAFNTSRGRNYNIFSPDGGSFETGGCLDVDGCRSGDFDPPAAVPEPASLVLLGSGLSALAWFVSRRKARAARQR